MISKYILIQSKQIVFNKIYFHYITFFFIQVKYMDFYYMDFSLNTFLVSISSLPFVFTKVRTVLSLYKLNNSTRM